LVTGEVSRKESAATCQAEIAAANALGTHTTYEPLKYRMGVEFGDRHFSTFGKPAPGTPNVVEIDRHTGDRYEALYFQNDILTGATLASNEPMDDRLVDQIKAGVSRVVALGEG
jgi:hypothetical protein